MDRDEDRQLWDLLGKSAAPQASPFFARNVVRELRKQESPRPAFFWLRWLAPAAGLAVVLIAGATAIHQPHERDLSATVVAKADLDDDVSADLDDLVGSDDDTDDTVAIR